MKFVLTPSTLRFPSASLILERCQMVNVWLFGMEGKTAGDW